jgi:hypothetical protein
MYSLLELVGLLSPVRSSVQGVISLVVDDVTMVTDEVVHSEASEENAKEVKRQRPRLLRLLVVSSQHWSRCLGLFLYSENKESISIHCIQTHIYSSSREINRMNSDLQLRRGGSVESVGRGGG